jgi:hypothetical protein
MGLASFLTIQVEGSLHKRIGFIRASFIIQAYPEPAEDKPVLKGVYKANCNG